MAKITTTQKISPFLWFDGKTEEAVKFYTSIFKNSKVKSLHYLNAGPPGEKPRKMATATFVIEGQEFMALDGGPMFKFTPAISFFVKCETQKEVDHYWIKLSARGGVKMQCGWLQDRYGISWQIVPNALGKLMGDKDRVKAKNVMDAMLKMKKLDIKGLEKAYKKK